MYFSKSTIGDLLSHTNIKDVVSGYVSLSQRGGNKSEYLALCPFHSERTPSFSVTTHKQLFHCFACGIQGNAIRFIEKYKGISYAEAVQLIAEISRFKLPDGTNPSKKKISDRKKYKKKLLRARRRKEGQECQTHQKQQKELCVIQEGVLGDDDDSEIPF